MGRLRAARKARAEARHARNEPFRPVSLECRLNGHAHGKYLTGWRCATCGNYISRVAGESYGSEMDGHLERRRVTR